MRRARHLGPPRSFFRWRGLEPYTQSFDAMRAFTETRTSETADEIWLVEHPPVFTLGLAGDPRISQSQQRYPTRQGRSRRSNHLSRPGQVVAYLLLDLRRRKLMVRGTCTANRGRRDRNACIV